MVSVPTIPEEDLPATVEYFDPILEEIVIIPGSRPMLSETNAKDSTFIIEATNSIDEEPILDALSIHKKEIANLEEISRLKDEEILKMRITLRAILLNKDDPYLIVSLIEPYLI